MQHFSHFRFIQRATISSTISLITPKWLIQPHALSNNGTLSNLNFTHALVANPERSFLMGHKIKAQTDIDRHLANLFDDQKFRPPDRRFRPANVISNVAKPSQNSFYQRNARGDDGDEICDGLEILGFFFC